MVNIEGMKPQGEFADLPIVNAANHPAHLKIEKVKQIKFATGMKAGKEGLVIEGSDEKAEIWSYFPNKTSIGVLADLYGDETDKWVGKSIQFETAKVQVKGKGLMNALFVKKE
jgi:hypothetical protein